MDPPDRTVLPWDTPSATGFRGDIPHSLHSLVPSPMKSSLALALSIALSSAAPAWAQTPRAATPPPSPAATQAAIAQALVTMHKHPSCGCCTVWAGHMRSAGFTVVEKNAEDLAALKNAAGVPANMASCHTAQVGGYFIEGHVPAADVRRLLEEKPDARGLAVPGMPIGSPGMEHPSGHVEPYRVMLVGKDGSASEFSKHP